LSPKKEADHHDVTKSPIITMLLSPLKDIPDLTLSCPLKPIQPIAFLPSFTDILQESRSRANTFDETTTCKYSIEPNPHEQMREVYNGLKAE
jgi:hypothetical protein